jgi:6-phosphogluconolactonase
MKNTRRLFALLIIFSTPLWLTAAPRTPEKSEKYVAYVGTYTTKTESKGIYVFEFDAATGKMTGPKIVAESQDPSYVVVSANGEFVYAVNEAGKNSMVSAFARDAKTEKLTLLNQMPALGEDPCFISFDKTGKFVLVANYTSGNVVVFPILGDGKLGEHTALLTNAGSVGPNKERQEGPHAHWIATSSDNRYAFVVDLGLDEVLTYRFDAEKGTLAPSDPPSIKLAGATGPRHLVISANNKYAYTVDELNSTVTAYSYDPGKGSFSVSQTISTLPEGTTGRNETAEITIHPSGKFLYASNRGHDAIAAFRIDGGTGKLTYAGDYSIEGKEPRIFVIDPTGKYVLVGDQLSDKIVVLRIDATTGALSSTGQSAAVPAPVDIAFVGVK